jgi:hypothetical protein
MRGSRKETILIKNHFSFAYFHIMQLPNCVPTVEALGPHFESLAKVTALIAAMGAVEVAVCADITANHRSRSHFPTKTSTRRRMCRLSSSPKAVTKDSSNVCEDVQCAELRVQ